MIFNKLFNQGLQLYRDNKYDEALTIYKKAIKIHSSNNILLFNYGLVLFKIKQYLKAIKYYKKSNSIIYNNDININIADAYIKLNYYKKAIKYYKIALKHNKNNLFALINLGYTYKIQNKIQKSLYYYNKALKIDKTNIDLNWNISQVLLINGKLKEGFEKYEYRYLKDFTQTQIPNNIPLYKGEFLENKKLLIYPEQGFGDNIQMARYITLLEDYGVDVYVYPLNELRLLFSKIKGIKLIHKKDIQDMDYYIKSMSLPYIFETSLNTIPNKTPYLLPIKNNSIDILFKHSKNKRVGIFWQGEPNHTNDKNRSIPFKLISTLLKIKNIDFYSLQIDNEKNNIIDIKNIKDCSPYINDFNDTAYIINKLDLVITIDSAIAHLSGALDITTWLLLPYHPDWRWLLKRDNSPWYPSMKLYRQQKNKDWNKVIKKVKIKLNSLKRS